MMDKRSDDAILRPVEPSDREWIHDLMCAEWGGEMVISRDREFYPETLPGSVAMLGDKVVGLITWRINSALCEIITLNSFAEHQGIGQLLVNSAIKAAIDKGCRAVILSTTNDNTRALRFYQMMGFRIKRVRAGAIKNYRKRKPSIPKTGFDNIPIRDEIQLEMSMAPGRLKIMLAKEEA